MLLSSLSVSDVSISDPSTSGVSVAGTSAPGQVGGLSEIFVDESTVETLTLSEFSPADGPAEEEEQQTGTDQGDLQTIVVSGADDNKEFTFSFDTFFGIRLVFVGGQGAAEEEELR